MSTSIDKGMFMWYNLIINQGYVLKKARGESKMSKRSPTMYKEIHNPKTELEKTYMECVETMYTMLATRERLHETILKLGIAIDCEKGSGNV
jgi:hypothetical protein